MQKSGTFYLVEDEMTKFKNKCSRVFLFLCVMIFALSVCINLTFTIAPVSGLSMFPTLNKDYIASNEEETQDLVILNYVKQHRKGDIIVAKKEDGSLETYHYVIKRLIAVGNDSVLVTSSGDLYVNDVLINQDYLTSVAKYKTYTKFVNLKSKFPDLFEEEKMIIPKGYVFYLGDNRGESYDCGNYGPVEEKQIVAVAQYIVHPGENVYLSILKQIFS